MTRMRALAIVACAATAGCGGKVGQGGPPLAVVEIIGADPAETSLGKALFFDTRVSSSGTTACATCHQPERGFSDGKRFSQGASGATLPRHTPHLYNLASMDVYFWDGRATSLEEQARLAIENPDEMGGSLEALVSKLSAVPDYERQFQAAFPRDGITTETIVRAIASFVRSLVSAGSPYDRYLEGEADADVTLIGWGSTFGVITEAVELLKDRGISANYLLIKWIVPFHGDAVTEILNAARRTIIVENNYSGQFYRYMRSETGLSVDGHIRKYDGEPFAPHHIVEGVLEHLASETDVYVPDEILRV